MSNLPKLIDPVLFAEKGKRLAGQIPLSDCDRLADMVLGREGMVSVDLKFEKNGATLTVSGEIEADVQLRCQVCLESIGVRINNRFNLGIVNSIEAADRLADEYEPLVTPGDGSLLVLGDLVQDELILSLPTYPKHPSCNSVGHSSHLKDDRKQNPFSVLESIK